MKEKQFYRSCGIFHFQNEYFIIKKKINVKSIKHEWLQRQLFFCFVFLLFFMVVFFKKKINKLSFLLKSDLTLK